MRPIVIDASALAMIAFGEEGGADMARALDGASVHAPTLLRYEMQNIATKKCRQHPERRRAMMTALERAVGPAAHITWLDPNPIDVALLADATGLTAYDASYLWLAGFLGADLITADRQLAAAHETFV